MEGPKLNQAASFSEVMAHLQVIGKKVGAAWVYFDRTDVATANKTLETISWQTVKLHLARCIIKSEHCSIVSLQYLLKEITHCLLFIFRWMMTE